MTYLKNIGYKKTIISVVTTLMLTTSLSANNEKVYAIVNGEKITAQSISVALKDPRVKFDTLPKETQQNILSKVVEQKILAQNAMTTDVVNNPIYKQTLKSLSQDLALQVWIQGESKKVNITDKETKDYFNNNQKLFKVPVQFHARHILLKTLQDAKDIISILTKSKDVKAKFISLAKEKSIGPSNKTGGDLGFFTVDKMVPEFSKATAKLKVGEITKTPVKTQFGFHVIYLEDKKDASIVSFEKAKLQIKQQIGQEKLMKNIQKIADKLKKKAKVEYK